jgi:hypothetical protein
MDCKKYIRMDVHQATISVAVMDSGGVHRENICLDISFYRMTSKSECNNEVTGPQPLRGAAQAVSAR